jgi:hypothetical protein
MRSLIITLALILTGCQTTKLVPEYVFPDPPTPLMVPGKSLKPIQKPAAGNPVTNDQSS